MSYNETGTHKKRRIAHPWVFRGTASAPFVPAQGLSQGLEKKYKFDFNVFFPLELYLKVDRL